MGLYDLPHRRSGWPSLHIEGAAGRKVSAETAAKSHIVHERAAQAGDPMVRGLDFHIAFHRGEDARLPAGRLEVWIGLEVKTNPIAMFGRDRPDECVG